MFPAPDRLKYAVGALLYTPAVDKRIAARICSGTFPNLSSLAFCFEDAISDTALNAAEDAFTESLIHIADATPDTLPLLFVRVRSADHLLRIYGMIEEYKYLITGFVLPKYALSNAADYERVIRTINSPSEKRPFFVMPILESEDIIYKEKRIETLMALKGAIDAISPYILNIRVGGNDFCRIYSLRRHVTQTIYDIALVKDVLTDILNIFSRDYVVSAPVWEYFESGAGDIHWQEGLEREIALDKLNGFIGKTAIHPSQLPVIAKAMQISKDDYEDALQIVHWQETVLGVAKGISSGRMNEVKVHTKWAQRILLLASIYGVADVR